MKHEVRKYKMTDAKLLTLAENLKKSAVRDLDYLEENGVSVASLNEFQRAIFDFSSKPTDELLSTRILAATHQMPLEMVPVMHHAIQFTQQANLANGHFKKYISGHYKHQHFNMPVPSGRQLQSENHEPLEELGMDGITQEMLDNLGCKDRTVDSINAFQINAIKNRDLALDDRIASGNALYAMMITLAAKGKEYWMDLSERRYNDYIATENYINNWQCADGHIDPFLVINISVTSITDATVFTLTNNSSVPLNFFFANNPAATSGRSEITVAPGNCHSYIATALGYDESTSKTRLNVYNGNALPGSYLVEWV